MDISNSYLCTAFDELDAIIAGRALHAMFQPVINLANAEVLGYEGLVRGPADSTLHAPLDLFQTA